MGFNDYHNSGTKNPAKVFHEWRGGEGKLTHWDGEANVESQLPMKFAILEQTKRIQGYAPMNSGYTRFFSNETVDYNDVMKVYKKVNNGPTEDVIEGKYSDIKDKLPQGARLASVLYIYNPETAQIEVITLKGSSLGAFIEFSKKNRIYEGFVSIQKGEEAVNGATHYFPPKFEMAGAYEKADMESLMQFDQEVIAYQKGLLAKAGHAGVEKIDQTPEQYEGEFSQEVNTDLVDDTDTQAQEGVDFNKIPF